MTRALTSPRAALVSAARPALFVAVRGSSLLLSSIVSFAVVLAACSDPATSTPPTAPVSVPCGSGLACTNGEICAMVLGQGTCQPAQDCQVFCLGGDAGGAPNPCGINLCPDETSHNKVFSPGMTTCTGKGAAVTIDCAYD